MIEPKILKRQFNENKTASINLFFRGKEFEVSFMNTEELGYGTYKIGRAQCDGEMLQIADGRQIWIAQAAVESMDNGPHKIAVELIHV